MVPILGPLLGPFLDPLLGSTMENTRVKWKSGDFRGGPKITIFRLFQKMPKMTFLGPQTPLGPLFDPFLTPFGPLVPILHRGLLGVWPIYPKIGVPGLTQGWPGGTHFGTLFGTPKITHFGLNPVAQQGSYGKG